MNNRPPGRTDIPPLGDQSFLADHDAPLSTRPIEQGKGWTNSYHQAHAYAHAWLDRMKSEGFTDIEMTTPDYQAHDGRNWAFQFRHTVTGVAVEFRTHGIDDTDAYSRQHVLDRLRTYWNGSSCGEPELADFAADGFTPVMTYRKAS